MFPKTLILAAAFAAFAGVLRLDATPILTTDFDGMTDGAVDAATLSAATPGGSWTFNTTRGATYEIRSDGAGDRAFVADDTNGGNAGTLEFLTVELDTPVDLLGAIHTIRFRTAAMRNGSGKALRFELLDETGSAIQTIRWENDNDVRLDEQLVGTAPFQFMGGWDPASEGVSDVTLTLESGVTTLDFGGAILSRAFGGSGSQFAGIRISSVWNEASNRGVAIDELEIDREIDTLPPFVAEFGATPEALLGSRDIELSWEVLSATSVTIDQGVGSVAPTGSLILPIDVGDLPKTFTLTATNANATPPDDVTSAEVTIDARGPTEAPVLMACWPFDGDVTESLLDWPTTLEIGPDGFDDISFVADVPAAIAARRSSSLYFSTERATLPTDDFLTADFGGVSGIRPRSVSFWVKRATPISGDGDSTIFSLGFSQPGAAYFASITEIGAILNGFRQSGSATIPDGAFPFDQWNHVALIYSGVDGDIFGNTTIYLNGTRYNQLGFYNGNTVDTQPSRIEFGRDRTDTTADFAAGLSLSEFTYYRGELTPDQVAALAAGGDPKMLDGTSTPVIPVFAPVLSSAAHSGPAGGTLELDLIATEGAVLELWTSTDLETDWEVRNATVIGTGELQSLFPAVDPVNEARRFFQIREK